jgi:hypothetical protein
VELVDRLVQVDRKVDPDADIPDRLRLSLKDGVHSHIHLLGVVPVPLLEDHAQVPALVPLPAAYGAEPMVDRIYSRRLHCAMLQMAGVQGLMGPAVSVDHREP